MSDLYLITGFLGAGKTTFLKNFIRLFPGKSAQLIVNEFGQEGIDGVLLADAGAELNEITGGSVFCSCRLDSFEKALRVCGGRRPDVILVEASGLADPTGVRRLFSQTGRFPEISYRGAVCLVDAVRFPKLYASARSCVKQLAASDLVLLNKTDLASPEQLAETRKLLHGQRPDLPVLESAFGAVGSEIFSLLGESARRAHGEMPLTADLTLRRLLITVSARITPYELEKFLEMFLEVTFRVKGFVSTTEGVFLADCVGTALSLRPYSGAVPAERLGRLVALSGAGMPLKSRVKEAAAWYPQLILSME